MRKSVYIEEEIKEILEFSKSIFGYKDMGDALNHMIIESESYKKVKDMLKEVNKLKEGCKPTNLNADFVEKNLMDSNAIV